MLRLGRCVKLLSAARHTGHSFKRHGAAVRRQVSGSVSLEANSNMGSKKLRYIGACVPIWAHAVGWHGRVAIGTHARSRARTYTNFRAHAYVINSVVTCYTTLCSFALPQAVLEVCSSISSGTRHHQPSRGRQPLK